MFILLQWIQTLKQVKSFWLARLFSKTVLDTLIGKKNGPDTGDTQDGNDSKAHLSGKSCPMYAVAKNVAASDVPTGTMKHLTSVVAVTVTNTNDDPLTVNSVSFSAQEGTLIFG